jgi:lactoylglutathione lyase
MGTYNHTGHVVMDLERSKRFYEEVFGFEFWYAKGAAAPYRTRTMNEPGLTHLSISVDDVLAAAEKAVEYGGEIIEESDLGLALFIRDPDGQLLELLPEAYRSSLPPKP